MGGFSALTLGLRNPGMFCSISGHSGMLDWARGFARKLKADPNVVVPERNPQKKIKPAIGLPDFDDQEERTPRGRIFRTVEECNAHDPYVLAATLPVEEDAAHQLRLRHRRLLLRLQIQDLLLILLSRKVPFTYSQSPGKCMTRKSFWRREILGMLMAMLSYESLSA